MKKVYNNMPGAAQTLTLNLTESIFKFKNGSSIHIEGTDDSVKIHGYHCDVLWINEGYELSRETFDQLDMRCSDFVILDLNPGNPIGAKILPKPQTLYSSTARGEIIHLYPLSRK
jgi:hypothetical protein